MTAILPPLWEGAEAASTTRGEGRLDPTCAILYFSSFPVALPLTVSGTLCYSMGALSGWLWRLLTDHSKLAAAEQAQLAASRVRSGWRPISHALTLHSDKRMHRCRLAAFESAAEKAVVNNHDDPAAAAVAAATIIQDSEDDDNDDGHLSSCC